MVWGLQRQWLAQLIDSGVDASTSDRRRYQTRAANVVALAFSTLSLPYVPLEYWMGAHEFAVLTAMSCFIYPLAIPLNRMGWSKTARSLPLVGGTLMALSACLVLTPASQVQLVLFMVGLWPFILFDAREEWRHLVGLQLLPAAVYVMVNAGVAPHIGQWTPSSSALAVYAAVVPVTTFVLNGVLLFLFYRRNQANEDRLISLVESLERANQAATIGERTKAEFLAVMSHEIRTPLHAVLGCAELVRNDVLTKDQEHWMRTLTNSAEYLLELMTNILEYSRLDGSARLVHETQVDVRSLVEDSAGVFAEAAASKGLEFWVKVEDGLPSWLTLDPGRLRLVVACLTSNAVKFTGGGHIEIRVAFESQAGDAGELRVSVTDTGIGIEAAEHQKIFDLFQQVDTFGKRREGGIGLGLSLSKAAVEVMRGTLTLRSVPGKGSTFMLSVPCRLVEADTEHLPSRRGPDMLRIPAVRVVTMLPDWSDALSCSLAQWGHVVLPSDCELPADVLLVDGRMFDDVQSLARLRRQGEAVVVLGAGPPTIPGVVTTARFLRRPDWFAALRTIGAGAADAVVSLPSMARRSNPGRTSSIESEKSPAIEAPTPGSEKSHEPPSSEPKAESAKSPIVDIILIADDQVTNQKILKKLAEKLGHRVLVVENGQLAVEAWQEHKPSVILMDVQMPVMDGLEATRQIRALEGQDRRTPIIAVTANALPEQRFEGMAAGMDEYLTKPIRMDELRRAIEQLCGVSRRDEVA